MAKFLPERDAPIAQDLDEYGQPVSARYERLGPGPSERREGLYVRFEPGFGLNVHIGWRKPVFDGPHGPHVTPDSYRDEDRICMSIGGWEQLGAFVDAWRDRQAPA